jgi:hypothetical protein
MILARIARELQVSRQSVGDLEGDPKSDILGQASFGIRTDRRPDIPA